MSLLSEISKTVVDASIVETESVLASDVTTGSLVAASAVADSVVADAVSGSNALLVESGLTLTGTLTNSSSERPPLLLQGTGNSQSVANVAAEELGFSLAVIQLSNEDFTLSREDQNGVFIYFDATALTTDRVITLPTLNPANLSGGAHVYINRGTASGGEVTINAGSATITGVAVTLAGSFSTVSKSTLVSENPNGSVHLVHAPDDASSWLIQGLSVGFV